MRPMQTDGWPEMNEGKQPSVTSEKDLQQAKAVILEWIKDIRAQPEVGGSDIQLIFPSKQKISLLIVFIDIDHSAAKCVARRTSGEESGGRAVRLALGPCSQSADRHGAAYVDFNVTAA